MTTLASDLVNETRRNLYSATNDEINRLDGGINSSITTLTLDFEPGIIARGAILAIDLEEILVWEVTGKVVTVQRGFNGSTAATHADTAMITIKPKFSDFRIFQALNHDLRDLSSPANGLYQIKTLDLSYEAGIYGYNLTGAAADMLGIQEVRYQYPGPENDWPLVRSFHLARNMNTADFASGTSLVISTGGVSGFPLRVKYKAPFGLLSSLTDVVETVTGLPATAIDLPPLGAIIRLVTPRDIGRAGYEDQGEPRRAAEVVVGANSTAIRSVMMVRQQRLLAEATRLAAMYPIVMW